MSPEGFDLYILTLMNVLCSRVENQVLWQHQPHPLRNHHTHHHDVHHLLTLGVNDKFLWAPSNLTAPARRIGGVKGGDEDELRL